MSDIDRKLSIQERLGFDKHAKLLIIQADDFGLCHSENAATIKILENHLVSSVSVMVPCAWFSEAMAYVLCRPDTDLGIHLTFNCEWLFYKWGPVAPLKHVKSLVDEHGYFLNNLDILVKQAKVEELEIEARAQIEKTLSYGVKVSHIDNHTMILLRKLELLELYLKLQKDYKLPVLLSKNLLDDELQSCIDPGNYTLNNVYGISIEQYSTIGPENYYETVLKNFPPGLSLLAIHAAYDDLEMQGIAAFDRMEFGSKWRQHDYDFITGNRCRQIIEEESIQIISWKVIQNMFH
jgi:chitin disaccharide deacetylase